MAPKGKAKKTKVAENAPKTTQQGKAKKTKTPVAENAPKTTQKGKAEKAKKSVAGKALKTTQMEKAEKSKKLAAVKAPKANLKKRKRVVSEVQPATKKKKTENPVAVKSGLKPGNDKLSKGKVKKLKVELPKKCAEQVKEESKTECEVTNRLKAELSELRLKMSEEKVQERKKTAKAAKCAEKLNNLRIEVVELKKVINEKVKEETLRKKEISTIQDQTEKVTSKLEAARKENKVQLDKFVQDATQMKETQRMREEEFKNIRCVLEDKLKKNTNNDLKLLSELKRKFIEAENAHAKCQHTLANVQRSFVAVQHEYAYTVKKCHASEKRVEALEAELQGFRSSGLDEQLKSKSDVEAKWQTKLVEQDRVHNVKIQDLESSIAFQKAKFIGYNNEQ